MSDDGLSESRAATWDWSRLEKWLIVLVSAHSFAVGSFLLFATRWGTAFGGWAEVEPLFFARQAGIFHFVVATSYLIEYFRYRGVVLVVLPPRSRAAGA